MIAWADEREDRPLWPWRASRVRGYFISNSSETTPRKGETCPMPGWCQVDGLHGCSIEAARWSLSSSVATTNTTPRPSPPSAPPRVGMKGGAALEHHFTLGNGFQLFILFFLSHFVCRFDGDGERNSVEVNHLAWNSETTPKLHQAREKDSDIKSPWRRALFVPSKYI